MKRRIALLLASAMLLTSAVAGLTSCSDDEGGSGSGKKGHVYYLNFKPEVDKQWQELAAKYTEETGVQVDVVTAADNKYMEKLTTEIAKEDAPTLFQISGVADLATWDEYCYDLTGSDPINELSSTAYALKNSEGKIKGLGYVSECFGIIVRKDLLEKAGHTVDEINSFETLKRSHLSACMISPKSLPSEMASEVAHPDSSIVADSKAAIQTATSIILIFLNLPSIRFPPDLFM